MAKNFPRLRAMHLLGGIVGPLLIAIFAGAAIAQDWSSCASELDSLRRRASDASTVAEDANDKMERAKRAEEEWQNCRRYPQIYDLLRDGCQGKRSEFESARQNYSSQLDELRSSLDDVDSKIRNVNNYCKSEVAQIGGPPIAVPAGVENRQFCQVVLRYKGRLPLNSLVDLCTKSMPIGQCKLCLGVP